MEELSDEELRQRLISHGFDAGPVNQATRPFLLRKLHRLEQRQNPECVPAKQSSPSRPRLTVNRFISGRDEGDGETSARSVAYDTPSLDVPGPTKRLMEIRDSLSSASSMLSTPAGPIEPIYKDRCQPRSILKRRESIKKRMMNFLDPSSLMLAVFLAFFAILVFFYYYNDSADRGTGLKVAVLVILPMFIYMVIKVKRQSKEKEIQQLMNGVIDILQKNAAQNPSSNYLPIQDIRIRLIPTNEIQKKQKLWEEVEKLLEATDPRIRREIHSSGGEEHHVWRWLPQDLPLPPAPTTSKLQ